MIYSNKFSDEFYTNNLPFLFELFPNQIISYSDKSLLINDGININLDPNKIVPISVLYWVTRQKGWETLMYNILKSTSLHILIVHTNINHAIITSIVTSLL